MSFRQPFQRNQQKGTLYSELSGGPFWSTQPEFEVQLAREWPWQPAFHARERCKAQTALADKGSAGAARVGAGGHMARSLVRPAAEACNCPACFSRPAPCPLPAQSKDWEVLSSRSAGQKHWDVISPKKSDKFLPLFCSFSETCLFSEGY